MESAIGMEWFEQLFQMMLLKMELMENMQLMMPERMVRMEQILKQNFRAAAVPGARPLDFSDVAVPARPSLDFNKAAALA